MSRDIFRESVHFAKVALPLRVAAVFTWQSARFALC